MSLILDLIFGEKKKYTIFTNDSDDLSYYFEVYARSKKQAARKAKRVFKQNIVAYKKIDIFSRKL